MYVDNMTVYFYNFVLFADNYGRTGLVCSGRMIHFGVNTSALFIQNQLLCIVGLLLKFIKRQLFNLRTCTTKQLIWVMQSMLSIWVLWLKKLQWIA